MNVNYQNGWAVPAGWKLVPEEPTEEMLAATSWPGCAKTDYRHMLRAAPQPAQQPLTEEKDALLRQALEGVCHEGGDDVQLDAVKSTAAIAWGWLRHVTTTDDRVKTARDLLEQMLDKDLRRYGIQTAKAEGAQEIEDEQP